MWWADSFSNVFLRPSSGAPRHKGPPRLRFHISMVHCLRAADMVFRLHMPHAPCFCHLGRSDRLQPLRPGNVHRRRRGKHHLSALLSCIGRAPVRGGIPVGARWSPGLDPDYCHNDHISETEGTVSHCQKHKISHKISVIAPVWVPEPDLTESAVDLSIQSLTAVLVALFWAALGHTDGVDIAKTKSVKARASSYHL
ncbi:hypothetical protein BOTBODRAFT_536645 [Botryobasidium botryosum FD-172 SS1]|uniref:Uncharacterized protein n=1 Tax=Botryobasidium botryosum (strain FD-172 SS1) TaxID=930990 RepID=A0A067M0P6_BOTB1|nr:hypothetical protein BOTBODRAFT_536645 [Botryobasidium botryosum FD-172 SS1]